MSEQSIPEFRELPGYPGYRVSNTGRVQSRFIRVRGEGWILGDQWRDLHDSDDGAGRRCVHICRDGKNKTMRVHRLVLLVFVGPCPPGMGCRHLNGNPADNRLENLAWGTHTENMADRNRHGNYTRGSRHFNAKLTEDDVRLMRRLRREGWSLGRLVLRFGIAKTTVAQIVTGKFWKHVPDALDTEPGLFTREGDTP